MDPTHVAGTGVSLRLAIALALTLLGGVLLGVSLARSTGPAQAAAPQVTYQTAEVQYQSQYPPVGY